MLCNKNERLDYRDSTKALKLNRVSIRFAYIVTQRDLSKALVSLFAWH